MTASFPVRLLSRLVGRDEAHSSKNDGEARSAKCAESRGVLLEALEKAIEVIEWCGANDKTPTYGYGKGKDAARLDGTLPGPSNAFNTPREFARYWPDVLRSNIAVADELLARPSLSEGALTSGSPGVVQKGERT